MITQINLRHFKCFELLKLPISKLTLLSGSNASGKSSVLQALVLLHQTMREHEWATRLILNGDSLKLGTVADVVDKVHGRRSLEISIADDDTINRWFFSGERSEMSMAVDRLEIGGVTEDKPKRLQYLHPYVEGREIPLLAKQLRSLTYITAERIGPREFYPLEDQLVATVVGPAGEHAVSLLHIGRDDPVIDELQLEGIPPTRLRQVEARMGTFFPGCGLAVEQVARANAVTLGIRTSEATDYHRPIHVGFGLTQVLPIVVAALSAKQGDILLIENPEVHLHPAGQALMGQFLASVANAGIQIIIESHSDHILNGIRRSIKSKYIEPEDVKLHYFRQPNHLDDQVVSPEIDKFGNIDEWPLGFFDQFDKDMNHFAGWEV